MLDNLSVQSGFARQVLYDTIYIYEEEKIKAILDKVEFFRNRLESEEKESLLKLHHQLASLKDIRGSLNRLKDKQVLDDIELFEIKTFALFSEEIRAQYSLPNLNSAILLLDPENNRIPHFYIYDAYSEELKELRKQIKELKRNQPDKREKAEELYYKSTLLEDEIRKNLSFELYSYQQDLTTALYACADLDITLAKAQQAIEMHLCKPTVSEFISYQGLFNPEVADILKKDKKQFQPIDINLKQQATVITGANMTGKSVVLKTVALAQTLFQFGFFIPATSAQIAYLDRITLLSGDDQNELKGLSSFGAEMKKIHQLMQEIKSEKKLLALIDEPAASTNPKEGRALVNALADFLTGYKVFSLIATHYGGITPSASKLRVKGLSGKNIPDKPNEKDLNRLIDYSLIEDKENDVPHEAIYIASLLGIDKDLLNRAKKYL